MLRLSSGIFITVLSGTLLMACDPASTTMSAIGTGARVVSQDRTPGMAVDDAIIETTINHYYFRKDVNDLFKNVDVDVYEGRAFLTGNVNQHETMMNAVELAWQVKGVREVINEIQVENTSNVVDAARDIWIEAQIDSRLLVTQGINSTNYNIEAVNGVVTLMGIAQNDLELQQVADIASRTKGVLKVISHVIMVDDPRRIIPKAQQPSA